MHLRYPDCHWRQKTCSYELREVHRSLEELVSQADSDSRNEDDVWLVYARTERLAAVLKFRLGVERPGVFLKLPALRRAGGVPALSPSIL